MRFLKRKNIERIEQRPQVPFQLDKFRKKRNISDYERAGAVSEQEAKEMFALAENLRNEVEKRLRSNYPELL